MSAETADIGIITFHCSDNVGALLQAYGLKYFLRGQGINAEIVRYEPPFMSGRHWWIPYTPLRTWQGVIWAFYNTIAGALSHLKNRKNFSARRANMNRFRHKYLVNASQPVLHFSGQLKKLPYRFYIVGSDQIWNPEITCGLQKVYFGVFRNRKKEKVIFYGASLGSSSMQKKYDRKFSRWISSAAAVSLRENSALSYVKRFYPGNIEVVLDPVFLPEKACWRKLENAPGKKGYLFLYITEPNPRLSACAKAFAQTKNLSVVKVCAAAGQPSDTAFIADTTAGPSEFLGYLHYADYVMTNSFHAAAFSIIYEKKFIVFPHSRSNERLADLLTACGLESRLYRGCGMPDIEAPINWKNVQQKTKEAVLRSQNFLLENLRTDNAAGRNIPRRFT